MDRVELALRCYSMLPLDRPLLVFLAFREVGVDLSKDLLPRVRLTPSEAKRHERNSEFGPDERRYEIRRDKFIHENCPELLDLDPTAYELEPLPAGQNRLPWALVIRGLGPFYIPRHEDVLKATHALIAPEAK